MSFELEHLIVAKRDEMERLAERHNQLVASLPKELGPSVVDTFHLIQAEISDNMNALLAVVAELEALCAQSEFCRQQQTLSAFGGFQTGAKNGFDNLAIPQRSGRQSR